MSEKRIGKKRVKPYYYRLSHRIQSCYIKQETKRIQCAGTPTKSGMIFDGENSESS